MTVIAIVCGLLLAPQSVGSAAAGTGATCSEIASPPYGQFVYAPDAGTTHGVPFTGTIAMTPPYFYLGWSVAEVRWSDGTRESLPLGRCQAGDNQQGTYILEFSKSHTFATAGPAWGCVAWGGQPAYGPPLQSPPEVTCERTATWSVAGRAPTVPEAGGPPNPSTNSTTCHTNQPVNCATGQFWHHFDELDVPGRGVPLHVGRTYVSGRAGVAGRLGFGWADDYAMSLATAAGGSVAVTQENGSTVTYWPTGSGGFTGSAAFATLVEKPDGSYAFTRRPDGTAYLFSAAGKLTAIEDRDGYATTLTYTGTQLTKVTDPGGRTLTYTYDAANRITKITDPAARSVGFGYSSAGDLATATDVRGKTWSFSYDTAHRMLSMTDPNLGVLRNVYDVQGRVTAQTDQLARRTTFAYTGDPTSPAGGTTTITSPAGVATTHDYVNLELMRITTAGHSTTVTYDPVTLGIASMTDANNNYSTWTYDTHGNTLSHTDPTGAVTGYTYSTQDDLLTATDPLGVTETATHDARGNLLTVSRPLTGTSTAQVTKLTYGDAAHPGDVTAVADPTGRTTKLTWTATGDLATSTDPAGGQTRATYDAVGRPLTQVSPTGFTTTLATNAFGDVTKITDPLGHATTYGWDNLRQLTGVTDAAGHVTTYTIDGVGQRRKQTNPDSTSEAWTYTGDGNLASSTDGNGKITQYTYDTAGLPASTTDPLGGLTRYTHDAGGRSSTTTDAAGRTTTRYYDHADRLTIVSDATGTGITYTYDAAGRRIGMTDPTGTSAFTYDSLDRLVSARDGAAQTVGYGYDLAGRVTRLTYPNGKAVIRGYDTAGRLSSVQDWLSKTTAFRYDAAGDLTGVTYPSGVTTTAVYDKTGNPTSLTHARGTTTLAGFTYGRNALDQVATAVAIGPVAQNDTFGYTARDALASRGSTAYAYDAADNPTTLGPTTQTFDARSRLLTSAIAGVITTYGYDPVGDRTSVTTPAKPAQTLTYDQASHLTAYGATTYGYDGDGLRAFRTSGSTTTRFVWDRSAGTATAPLLADGASTYVYGPGDLPVESITGTVATFLHADQSDSTRLITDAAGAVTGTYSYDPYGKTIAHTGASTPLQYDGQYTDVESGYQYLRARYYDPATAQFLTVDPLVAQTGAPYTYANGDPLNRHDPSGLDPDFAHAHYLTIEYGALGYGVHVTLTHENAYGGVSLSRGPSWSSPYAAVRGGRLNGIDHPTCDQLDKFIGGNGATASLTAGPFPGNTDAGVPPWVGRSVGTTYGIPSFNPRVTATESGYGTGYSASLSASYTWHLFSLPVGRGR